MTNVWTRRCSAVGALATLTMLLAAAPRAGAKEPRPVDPNAAPRLMPTGLPADETIWPNQTSFRNSDPWLVAHHDQIRQMRPRVLVINFANTHDMDAIRVKTEAHIKALAESTRYHGFEDPNAPAFLQYEVVKYVDMRDRPIPPEREQRNSAFFPYKPKGTPGQCFDYGALYNDTFARFYGFEDPDDHTRCLNLDELINYGIVNELWFYGIHDDRGSPLESIEDKQFYDENCQPIPGKHGPSGNGHDPAMHWSGRSFRITFFNIHRGVGCGMESFSHAFEGISNHDSIAYFRKYFLEFSELNLQTRYPQLPGPHLYAVLGNENHAEYPDEKTLVVYNNGKTYRCENYINQGGSVHFPPGARNHYDLKSDYVVLSVIESWRQHNGPDGKDLAKPFHREIFEQYADVAPDCMGRWLIYWRQCVPGLDNRSVDDDGKPMKNWWVFLFY